MPAHAYTVGPGTLTIGEVGDEEDFSMQITEATLEWDVDAEDDEYVLSGDVIPGEETFTAKLSGEAFQDLRTTGFTRWSITNRGAVLPFVYIPSTVEDAQITGELKVRPMSVGGAVKGKAKSTFEFPCVGEPSISDVP